MSIWKSLLLNLYYKGSYPLRVWSNAQLRAQGRSPVIVLFYHRVADDHANPWTACNAMFEAQRRVRAGRNERTCVSITFDDGYADNCDFALPLLIQERIPCTYFVSSSHILTGNPFPHDLAQGRPLQPNTPEQIRELARAGVEIGAHTRTHADLGRISDPDRLYDELVVARHELQALTGTSVRYFAFPYGQHVNLSSAAFRLARSAGYEGVCSAYGGFNFPGDDPFHLQRIHVDDDMIRLKNWATLDPCKLRSVERYQYETKESGMPIEPAGASA
jgi:peptidoglycan/xylan/chitin deacetylase (PgdA/CDA1 family)